jgi:hypothetical protein
MGLLWDDQAERRVLIFGLRCGKRKTDPFGVAAGKKFYFASISTGLHSCPIRDRVVLQRKRGWK